MKLAITGRPGSGKTTLVRRLVEALRDHYAVGGIYTQELRDERGRRVGFEILDLAGGGRGLLAHVEIQRGPKVGKYRVNVRDVERALISNKPLIVTFQQRSQHPLVRRIRRECEVYEITPSNREGLFQELLARLRSAPASPSA